MAVKATLSAKRWIREFIFGLGISKLAFHSAPFKSQFNYPVVAGKKRMEKREIFAVGWFKDINSNQISLTHGN